MATKYRIAQIVEWNRSGQGCIALLHGDEVVSRHADYAAARVAYKAAVSQERRK